MTTPLLSFVEWAQKYYGCSASLIPDQARDAWDAALRSAPSPTGITVTFTREQYIGGLRYDPGRYRIIYLGPVEGTNDAKF